MKLEAGSLDSGVVPGHTNRGSPSWVVWLGALTVSGAAAALSFTSLAALARATGVSPPLDALFPLAIDAGVLVSAKFWLTPGLAQRASRFARTLTLALILVSCVFNVASHALHPAPGMPFLLLAAVSLLPPLTLAGIAHLMALTRSSDPVLTRAIAEPVLPPQAEETTPEAAIPSAPREHPVLTPQAEQTTPILTAPDPRDSQEHTVPGPESASDATVLPMRPRSAPDPDQALLDQLRALSREQGALPSIRTVKERLRVGHPKAKKLLEVLESEAM